MEEGLISMQTHLNNCCYPVRWVVLLRLEFVVVVELLVVVAIVIVIVVQIVLGDWNK